MDGLTPQCSLIQNAAGADARRHGRGFLWVLKCPAMLLLAPSVLCLLTHYLRTMPGGWLRRQPAQKMTHGGTNGNFDATAARKSWRLCRAWQARNITSGIMSGANFVQWREICGRYQGRGVVHSLWRRARPRVLQWIGRGSRQRRHRRCLSLCPSRSWLARAPENQRRRAAAAEQKAAKRPSIKAAGVDLRCRKAILPRTNALITTVTR
jgi:hypothetical protein